MHHPRWRIVTALSGIALFATLGLGSSAPAQAEPDIEDVQARVDRLFHEAEQASERLHDAELELAELKRDLSSLTADQQRQDASLEAARDELQDSIVSQYQGQSLAAVGQVVVSDDPSDFLSGLSTMSAYQGVQAQLFDAYATEAKALDIRADATGDRLAEIKRTEALLVEGEGRDRAEARRGRGAARPAQGGGARRAPLPRVDQAAVRAGDLRSRVRRARLRDGPGGRLLRPTAPPAPTRSTARASR